MLVTHETTVDLIDTMGSDLTVVNSARVSFDKTSDWERESVSTFINEQGYADIPPEWQLHDGALRKLKPADEKLIAFLARENHWSPFSHCTLQFRISAPIFVARQLGKHQVGLSWNEISRRYVDTPPRIYMPARWRMRAPNKKQGSDENNFVEIGEKPLEILKQVYDLYIDMLNAGVAPEQARMVLPQNMMTDWYWTGSLYAFARVANLRCKADTQQETRMVAKQIRDHMRRHFPISSKHILDNVNE